MTTVFRSGYSCLSRRSALRLGASVTALWVGLTTSVSAAAQQQAVPGDPQCPANGTEIACTGAAPFGFDVPPADRDRYTRLTLRAITSAIDARAPDGVAIDFFNEVQPVSILIESPGLSITSRGASYPRGDFIVGSSSAIGVRARSRGNIAIDSNANIGIDADTIDYGSVELVAGLAAEMIQTGTATRDLTLRNRGTITITSDQGAESFTNRIAGIWAGYSGIEGLSPAPPRGIRIGTAIIENSGSIAVERGAGILTSDLDYGTLDVLNSGTIDVFGPNGDVFAYGINVEAGPASNFGGNRYQRVTVRNTGTISIEDRGASVVGIALEKNVGPRFDNRDSEPGTVINDGIIIQRNMEGLDFGTGIQLDQGLSLTTGNGQVASRPGSTLTAINNGSIDVASYGISVQSNANRIVRNTGTINVTALRNFGIGVLYDFASPSGSDPSFYNPIGNITRFENSVSGVIRVTSTGAASNDQDNPSGVIIYGGDPEISNAGTISASGRNAIGLSAQASFQIFGSSGIPAIIGRVDAVNSGTIEANGDGATAFNIVRIYNSAADARDTILTNSGSIIAAGDGAVGILHSVTARPDRSDLPTVNPAIANLGNATYNLTAGSIVRGGTGTGAAIRFAGGNINQVTNAGVIAAGSGQAIIGGTGSERIANNGRIEGSVNLGAGDDRIDARDGGLITGAVDGGAGNDTIGFDVASGTTAFADRFGGAVMGFELLEKTGSGILTLGTAVAARVDLLGGTLRTSGALGGMTVNGANGTLLEATGALGAVTLADGAALSPGGAGVGTLDVASLLLSAGSRLRFDLGAPGVIGGSESDLINVAGNLTLDGLFDINARPNFGNGVYRLINYGGALTDNGLTIGNAPGSTTYDVQTSVAGQVNLVVSGIDDLSIQFWDDGDTSPDGQVDGGPGTWNASRTNWTNLGGTANNAWAGSFAVFQTTGGEVTVEGVQNVTGMQFMANGYGLSAGTGGAINLNAAETMIRVDPDISAELAVVLTGTGALVKRDLGTLILTGTNSYGGGTQVREGVLQVASDASLGSAAGGVLLDGGVLRAGGALTSGRGFTFGQTGGTIDTQGNIVTLSGVLAGTGMLTKLGSGTLTLAGNSAGFSGPVTLGAGTLAISGTLGSLVTVNAGLLEVSGSLLGGALVNGGRLNLSGTLGGTTTIAPGATLTGTGTLGNLILGGTLAPGNSPGVLNATGNVIIRAGSFYDVEVAASGATDLLRATGTATLEGGTVRVTTLDPDTQYTDGSRYTILTAAGGLTGTFAGLTESSAFLDFALSYDGNNAYLTVDVIRMFPDVALTFNQTQSSTALMGFNASSPDALGVYNQLLLLDANAARAAFDLASGEIYAATMASALRQGDAQAGRLLARSVETSGEGLGIWAGVTGSDSRTASDGNGAEIGHDGFGGEFGLDYRGEGNRWTVGIGGGYSNGDTVLAARNSRTDKDGWHLGGYARYGTGGSGFTLSASSVYASGTADVARTIAFGTLARTATARVDIETFALAAEARFGLDLGGGWAAGPLARVGYANTNLGGFVEAGADSLNLAAAGNDDSFTRFGGGAFARYSENAASFDLAVGYVGGGEEASEALLTLAGTPGAPFRVRSAAGDGDGAFAQAGASFDLGGGWSVNGNIRGTAGESERIIAGNVSIGWRF